MICLQVCFNQYGWMKIDLFVRLFQPGFVSIKMEGSNLNSFSVFLRPNSDIKQCLFLIVFAIYFD